MCVEPVIKVINDHIVVGKHDGIWILSDELKTVNRFDNIKDIKEITGNENFIAVVCDDNSTGDIGQVVYFPTNGESKPTVR